jgi:UDP-2-acetamido-3-amino-2,3-dideoxy-glucuronate N-acetyltransferase
MTKPARIAEVGVLPWKINNDPRGSLTAAEFDQDMPFVPKRCFMVTDVPEGTIRGHHAHKVCHQLLVCLHGVIEVELTDGDSARIVRLSSPGEALHIPPRIWGTQSYKTNGAVLLVFCSHSYDRSDYISDFQEFLKQKS